jgi:hypothetical protein
VDQQIANDHRRTPPGRLLQVLLVFSGKLSG